MMRVAVFALAMVMALGVASAQEVIGLTMQFDNRGSKVADKTKAAQILAAVADCVCDVPATQVRLVTTLGQSTLLNHQSVQTYECVGPTRKAKALKKTCEANVKDGIFSSSNAKKCIKKYTDTWAIGDSVKLQNAKCTEVMVAAVKGKPAAPVRTSTSG